MTQSTFSAQVANKLLTILQGYSKTIRLLLVMFLTLTASTAWAEEATLSFADKAQRTSFSTTKQVWAQNGVTFTNDKASSTNAVADYAKPVRLYANSSITVECASGNMTKIVFDCNNTSYATAMKNSIGSSATASSDKVTVTLDGTSNTFTVAKLTAQVRLDAITVTYATAATATEYNITYTGDDHITYTGTKPETIKKEDGGFELEFSVNDGYQLNDVQVKMGGQNLVFNDEYYWEEGYILIVPETDITGDIVITFVTVSTCTTNPTISAARHSNITSTTATVSCSGGITSLGSAGCSIESYGFVYGTSINPTISNTKEQVGTTYTTTGTAFSKELTGLTANTTYYVRPYATNGNGTAYGTQTSFKTLELPKYTVTLVPGSGSVTSTTLTETSTGAGVTLPTPTLDCGDWEFAGWAAASVGTETTTKPTLIAAGTYNPTANTTLHAVYQRTEETEGDGGTENVSKSYTFADYTAGTQYADNEVHKLDDNVTLTTTDCHFTSELRIYSSSTYNGYVVSNKLPGRIVSIGFNAGNKVDKIAVYGSTNGTAWTEVGQVSVTSTSYKDYTLSFGETNYTYFKLDVVGSNQVRLKSITITWESTSAGGTITTTYYNSNPVCQTCENVLTISKGAESNGTFTLSKSGEIKTCDGEVEVVVKPTPTNHYHIGSVTATPTTGDAPTVKDNGDGTWTVTYAQNSTGVSTINVTFDEDAKATIILSELGETTTDNSYVGEQYTLPTTSLQSCEGKVLVGWSTVEVVETDTKPTENYYELGATVTLEAEQTFYAVFAKETIDGGGVNFTIDANGDFMIGAKVDGVMHYASGKIGKDSDGKITGIEEDVNATIFTFTSKGNGEYSIYDNSQSKYLAYGSSTDLKYMDDEYIWTIIGGENGTWRISSGTIGRALIYRASTYNYFGGYSTSNCTVGSTYYDIEITAGTSATTYTDYSTSCGTFTITYYGFNSGGCTTTCGENPAEIEVAQGAPYTIPNCVPNDPAGLGRTFAGTWNTQADGKGTTYEPGESFTVDSDITLYAQWILKTTEDIVLPTDVVDLATTDIVVTGGTTLTLQAGTTTLNSLTLEGGRTNDGYLMPAIYSDDEASVELTETTIPFYLSVDMANYYPFAVPFPVAVNQVNYADPTLANASEYGTHYVIKRYDGANRANQGENKNANWVKVEDTETLQPGIGYIITAVPIGGEALIRFPMTPEQLWSSEGKTVDVAAYTGAAAQQHPRHAGWNFIANPYLSRFAGVNVGNEKNLLNGVLNYVNGEWQKTGEVPYVTIPAPDFSYYEQVELDNAILSPSYAFFVQAAQNATLSFATAGRQQNMPALRAAAVEPLRLPLTISQSTQSDRTTLLVSDDYTANYEIGKDLEKMFGSAEQVSLYAWSSNTPLAYCAVPWASAIQAIPLGYRTNKSGSVTIALDASADMSDAEMVLLYDAVTGMTTNLLINSYTFETEVGTHDARFTVMITPKQGATTGCEEVMLPTDGTYKFLRNGQLYINHRGTVYTVEGRENSRVRQ